MTEDEAIAQAERAASDAGYRLDDYEQAGVTGDEDGWRIFYRLRPPGRPGGHFAVRVKAAGEVSITPGR